MFATEIEDHQWWEYGWPDDLPGLMLTSPVISPHLPYHLELTCHVTLPQQPPHLHVYRICCNWCSREFSSTDIQCKGLPLKCELQVKGYLTRKVRLSCLMVGMFDLMAWSFKRILLVSWCHVLWGPSTVTGNYKLQIPQLWQLITFHRCENSFFSSCL